MYKQEDPSIARAVVCPHQSPGWSCITAFWTGVLTQYLFRTVRLFFSRTVEIAMVNSVILVFSSKYNNPQFNREALCSDTAAELFARMRFKRHLLL